MQFLLAQHSGTGGGDSLACAGVDLALIAASEPPAAPGSRRFAACADGYIVYTASPAITPPNLAAVQELSVGIVRVSAVGGGTGGPITPLDTLELWVDDVRLGGVVDDPGYAGQFGVTIAASDVGSMTVNVSRRDHNFRQLAEQPSYVTDDQLSLSSSLRLDRLLPRALRLAIPLTVVARYADIYTRGVPTTIVIILLLGGIQLITVGIIGEYVGRIYDEVKHRPLYVVRDRVNVEAPDPSERAGTT